MCCTSHKKVYLPAHCCNMLSSLCRDPVPISAASPTHTTPTAFLRHTTSLPRLRTADPHVPLLQELDQQPLRAQQGCFGG